MISQNPLHFTRTTFSPSLKRSSSLVKWKRCLDAGTAQYPGKPHPSPLRVPGSAVCLGRCFTSSREVISPPGISVLEHSFRCFIELGAKLAAFPLLSCSATLQVFTIYCWHLWQRAQPRHASEGHRGALLNALFCSTFPEEI